MYMYVFCILYFVQRVDLFLEKALYKCCLIIIHTSCYLNVNEEALLIVLLIACFALYGVCTHVF